MLRKVCTAFFIVGFVATSVSTHADGNFEKDEIIKIRSNSNEAIRNHDAEGIVASFDGIYQITTGSGELFHDGPEEQKKSWMSIFAEFPDVIYVRTPTRIDVSNYLPRAAESGNWVGNWTTDKGRIEVGGSYSASWLKIEGRWKIQSEMFVTLYCSGNGC